MPQVRRLFLVGLIVILLPAFASAQLLTGTITGTVSDNSGAVMPGVSVIVSGERLIGGPQTRVTNERGEYRVEGLPPGTYGVKFELQGFNAIERREIQLSAGFVATIHATLLVGSIEETVVVTGASPTVDTKSNVQQTVMNQQILEGVPTGRDVWSLAKIIPGVSVSTYDVGGTQGMQQSDITAHGSRAEDKTFAIDGLSVNWSGTGGGATMVYYDQGMFEEVNYQTSAIPAEVAIGGVYMNMVTKAGGNKWRGDAHIYYTNDSMQAKNFADVSAKYNFLGGNPITGPQYDINVTGAGPIMKDKIWAFTSFRRWRVDKKLLSVYNSDGTNAVDDNQITNGSLKLTTQFTPNHRLGAVYNYNQKNRYHRRDTPPYFLDDKASYVQLQPGSTGQIKYTGVFANTTVFESTAGGVWGIWPLRYQKDVKPTDIYHEDSVLSTAWGAAPRSYENPNYRFQFDNIVSHMKNGWGGSHNFKGGVQFTRQMYKDVNRANYDMRLYYNNGVAYQVRALNTPVSALSYTHQLGFFGQDSWSIGKKLTLNLGFRADRVTGFWPEQSSPAGVWVGERKIAGKDVYKQWRPVWRAGGVYDVFGTGQTAIKGNVSRYAHQVGTAFLINNIHPFAISTANIAWTDLNRNDFPDSGELGTFEGFTGGVTSHYADSNGPAWGYSDEITAGIEHQLIKDVRVGVMYYRRSNRKLVGGRNILVPTSAYAPVTIANPLGGTLTFYNLDRSYVGKQETVRQNIDLLDNDYNGIEVTAAKRFAKRWQMLFGFTAGKNKGGIDFGTATDYNDPNNLINQQGVPGNDSTYSTKLSGSYLLPKVDVSISGSYVHNTGYPRHFSYAITRAIYPGLTRSSQTVYVNERGTERRPTVSIIDLRFSRPIKLRGGRTFEPQLDVFNVTNSDVIVGMVDTVGARLGYPSEILAPRIIRFGFAFLF